MASKTSINVSIFADVKRFSDGMAKVRADAQTTSQKIKNAFKEVGTAGNAIRTAGVLLAFNSMKNAASNLEQAVGGTSAVFGDMSSIIDSAAKDSANSMGLSERAFREATSRMGASLVGLGYSQADAARESIRLTEIGADLAATFGGPTQGAIDALSAALRGERDPLERYGIALTDATLKAKAMEMGLYSGTGALDQQATAQATLALVTERSAGAIGQFGREADTEAGKAARAAANMENAQAAMGKALLPIYSEIYNGISRVATAFQMLPGPAQSVVVALIGFAGLFGPVKKMVTALKETAIALGTFAKSHPYITAFVAAATIAAVVLGRNADSARQAKEEMQGYASAMRQAGDAAQGTADHVRQMVEEYPELAAVLSDAGVTAQEMADALIGSDDDWEAFTDKVLAAAEASGTGGLALEALASGLDSQRTAALGALETNVDVAEVNGDVAASADEAAEAIAREGGAFGDQAEAARNATSRVDDYLKAQRRLIDPVFNMTEAQRKLNEAQTKYDEVMKNTKSTEDERADALEEVIQSTYDLDAAAVRLSTDVRTGAVNQAEANKRLDEFVAKGLITKAQADRMRDAFAKAAREANGLAGNRSVYFTSNIAEQIRLINEYNARLKAVDGTVVRTYAGPGGGPSYNALGG